MSQLADTYKRAAVRIVLNGLSGDRALFDRVVAQLVQRKPIKVPRDMGRTIDTLVNTFTINDLRRAIRIERKGGA